MTYNEVEMIKSYGKHVTDLMKKQKLSLSVLSQKTGLSVSEIRNIKDAKIKKINSKNLMLLANYFHIAPSEMLGTGTMPDDVDVKEEYVEFVTSFFEKEGGDFLFYNKIPLLPKYDEEFEKCVVQAIHSYIEAHKLATGYYYENINSEETKVITRDKIQKQYSDMILDECFEPKTTDENRQESYGSEKEFTSVVATGLAIQNMRKLYGISRKDLAIRTGLSEDCMYRIETGKNTKLNYEHINFIARELCCTVDFLLGESCDPTANRDGSSVFYHIEKELIFRYVQLGHDFAYAYIYMDQASIDTLKCIIDSLDMMYKYKKVTDKHRGKRLSLQDVFFREQKIYQEKYNNRGAHFYTKKYFLRRDSHEKENL